MRRGDKAMSQRAPPGQDAIQGNAFMGYLMRKSMNGASPAQATPATQFPTATPPFVSRTELRKVINNQPCAQAVSLVPNQGASDSQGVFRCCLRAPLQAGATRSEGTASETKRWADRPSRGPSRPTTKESGRRRAAPRRPAAPRGAATTRSEGAWGLTTQAGAGPPQGGLRPPPGGRE